MGSSFSADESCCMQSRSEMVKDADYFKARTRGRKAEVPQKADSTWMRGFVPHFAANKDHSDLMPSLDFSQVDVQIKDGSSNKADLSNKPPKLPIRNLNTAGAVATNEPEPLLGWTISEQRVLLDYIDQHKAVRRDSAIRKQHFSRLVESILRNKSVAEVEACFQHLQSRRIVYFGSGSSNWSSSNSLSNSFSDSLFARKQ